MTIFFRAMVISEDWDWIQSYVPVLLTANSSGIVAVDLETKERVAVTIFDNWTDNSCQAHIIIVKTMALRHGFLEECFNYVFIELGKKYMLGVIQGDNEKALKLDLKMGFEEKYRIKDGYEDGVDLVFIEMHRDNCRFIDQNKLKKVA
jgi:hypothetical protein